jgi:hypothetical protein
MGTYLVRTGTEERELVRTEWMRVERPETRLMTLADAMDRACRDGRIAGSELLEALAAPPTP